MMKDAVAHCPAGAVPEPRASHKADSTPPMPARVGLLDLFRLEDLQRIQDEFSAATGVASVITDVAGQPVTVPSNFCRLCRDIIRRTDAGLRNCMRSDAALGRPHPDGPVVQRCLSGGLWDGGASICAGDQHVGNWLVGQVLEDTCDIKQMVAYARSIGANEQTFLDALAEVPRMPLERFRHVCQALFLIAGQLSQLALRTLQQAQEIHQRRQDLVEARDSRNYLDKIINTLVIPVFVKDRQHRWVLLNDAYCQFMGKPRAELLGRSDPDFFPAAEAEVFWRNDDQVLLTGDSHTSEEAFTDAHGQVHVIITRKARYTNAAGEPFVVGTLTDITGRKHAEEEKRRLEAQVQHSQRLESLGVLAGGIAHDFNNLLVAILGNADLALKDLEEDAPARDPVLDVKRAAQQAAELTAQMLAYSGRGRFQVQVLDVNALVEEMANLLRLSLSKKAEFRLELAPGLPPVEADVAQLRQVVMNLVTNASDALPGGRGEIHVRTQVVEADAAFLANTPLPEPGVPGRYVSVEVADTGCGMDQATLARIFDPFFTTKFAGRGLGLAAVLGIVRGHRGALRVDSTPGQGTRFQVLFPAASGLTAPVPRLATPAPGPWRGQGTVLVADDDSNVRKVARRVLERVGFRVLLTHDGEECVRVFQADPSAVSVVLLDMTMPRLGGEEAFAELRRLRPDVPIVLTSGFTEQESMRPFAGQGRTAFLQKPFEVDSLVERLRQALE